MQGLHIIKKFKDLTLSEERGMAATLNASKPALEIIRAYLEGEVTNLDRQLTNVETLYDGEGDSHLKVACILSQRATNMKLLTLLTTKVAVTLDDQSEEV